MDIIGDIQRLAEEHLLLENCSVLARGYDLVERGLQQVDISDVKGTDILLDKMEAILWKIEAKIFGVDVNRFKIVAPLYRHGFSREDIEGDESMIGVVEYLANMLDEEFGSVTMETVRKMMPSLDIDETFIFEMLIDSISPQQWEMVKTMDVPRIVICPAGGVQGLVSWINQHKIYSEQNHIEAAEKVDLDQFPAQPRRQICIVESSDLEAMRVAAGTDYLLKLHRQSPVGQNAKYEFFEDQFRKNGADVMGVKEYLVSTYMDWLKSFNAGESASMVFDGGFYMSILNKQDFPMLDGQLVAGSMEGNSGGGKTVLGIVSEQSPRNNFQYRPSIRVAEF